MHLYGPEAERRSTERRERVAAGVCWHCGYPFIKGERRRQDDGDPIHDLLTTASPGPCGQS